MSCRICELNAAAPELPPRERLYVDERWRVSHGWSSLPGWLVVAPRRHVDSLAELEPDEASSLGLLLRATSVALREIVGCKKTYVIVFAEQEGFGHLHVHLVPRMPWFGPDDRGVKVFRFLNVPEDEQVPPDERERLAAALGQQLTQTLSF